MKANEVMSLLNITRQTLSKYVKNGNIKISKLPSGRYIYDDFSVYSIIGTRAKKHNTKIYSYARVSTNAQKEQLHQQTQRIYDYCLSKGIVIDKQLEDIKSGMSFDRKNFQKLCEDIIRGNVEMVVIENKDRLMRFGFELFEGFFRYFGTTILVLNEEISNKSYEQELTEDLISILHYFSMKSYSHRRKINKMRKELEQEERNKKQEDN